MNKRRSYVITLVAMIGLFTFLFGCSAQLEEDDENINKENLENMRNSISENNKPLPTFVEIEGIDQSIIVDLGSLTGNEVFALDESDFESYDSSIYNAIKSEVDPERSLEVLESLFLKEYENYQPFLTDIDDDIYPSVVCIIKSPSQFDILSAVKPNGSNYGIETEDIIEKLKEWDEKYKIRIRGVDEDWIEIQFIGMPKDIAELAEEIYEFCPDTVDQGAGSIEELTLYLKEERSMFFWWD